MFVVVVFARATQLRRVIVGNAVHAPFVLLSRQTLFELEESLSLFSVVQLKAEQKFIIEDVFEGVSKGKHQANHK